MGSVSSLPFWSIDICPMPPIAQKTALINNLNIVIAVVFSYLAISFILQTKDDFRFIIPYVEFSKQTKGARPMLLDTSVLIDGRIADIAETGILDSRLIVPRFVLSELQTVADSGDKLKRNRGRRGLDVSPAPAKQQAHRGDHVRFLRPRRRARGCRCQAHEPRRRTQRPRPDQRFQSEQGRQPSRRGCHQHQRSGQRPQARRSPRRTDDRPPAQARRITRARASVIWWTEPWSSSSRAGNYLNEEIEFTVTSVLQTSAGKMIFGRLPHEPPARRFPETILDPMPEFAVILPAAGRSTRFGGTASKLLQPLDGRPVLAWTLWRLRAAGG